MSGNPKQKLKLLYIADYLRSCSDPEHPVSTSQIAAYLQSVGIESERKSIYKDLGVLAEYGLPVEKSSAPLRGYYLSEGMFQLSELMMLIDAVQASPVITARKTAQLTDKLRSFASKYQAERLERHIYVNGASKSTNEEIYYNIDRINTCINSGVKVSFLYRRSRLMSNIPVYDTGREFIISPYSTIWNEDKYYLIGNYEKYDGLSHYRIDRMRHVEPTDMPARDVSEVSEYKERFDAADYSRKVFNMFSGSEEETVELVCENRLLETIMERFGISIPYRQVDDEHFSARINAIISDGLINWIINFGGGITVRSPESLREKIAGRLKDMLSAYDIT